jgi:hypothetical protein
VKEREVFGHSLRTGRSAAAGVPRTLEGLSPIRRDLIKRRLRIAPSIGAVGRQEIWALENFLPSGN